MSTRHLTILACFCALGAGACSDDNGQGGPDAFTPGDTAGGDGGNGGAGLPALEPFEPPDENVIIGQVVSSDGVPLQGITVTVGTGDDAATGQTNYDGLYYIETSPKDRMVVRFAGPGYAPVTKTGALLEDGRATVNAVLLKRPASVEAVAGAMTPVSRGTVMVPAGAVVDGAGNAVTDVRVRVTPVDVTSREIMASPGDFSAMNQGGEVAQLETFGLAEYELTGADGELLAIKDGEKVQIEMLLPEDTTLTDGEVVPAWSFDMESGRWIEDGEGTVQPYSQDPARLAFVTEVGHFSWWNADKEMETTCIEGTVRTCDGQPAAGADILTQGVDYNGTSSGYSGADGTFCAPARKGSSVEVFAASGYGADRLVAMQLVSTPDTTASCGAGPCVEIEITLPCSPEESEFDCDDIYFAGCKSCLKGSVQSSDGQPVASAHVKITTGSTAFTVMTDANGEYCAPAAEGSPASVVVTGAGGGVGIETFTPGAPGECPDCGEAPTVTLEEQTSAGGGDSDLDFTQCLTAIAGLILEPPILNGADPNLLQLDSGWAYATHTSFEGAPDRWDLDLTMLPEGTTTSLVGRPGATFSVSFSQPPEARTYTIKAFESDTDPYYAGRINSSLGTVKGLGNETYEITTLGTETGSGTLTLTTAFREKGDPVQGTFDLIYEPTCAPRAASVTLRGSFDTVVHDSLGFLPSSFDENDLEFQAWLCQWHSFYVDWGNFDSFWSGTATAALDGQPIPVDPDAALTGTAVYGWESDRLFVSFYGVDTTLFFSVDNVVSGTNEVSSGSLILANSGCFWAADDGEVVVQDFAGADNDTWFTGSFTIAFEPTQGSDASCESHTVTGQFGAPICRQ